MEVWFSCCKCLSILYYVLLYYSSRMRTINIFTMFRNAFVATIISNTITGANKSPEIKESMAAFHLLIGCSL